jgi:hypothetical protein
MDLREVQSRLISLGLYDGPIGASERSKAHDDAVMALFRFGHVRGWDRWPAARRTIAAGQLLCRMDGIDPGEIDGLMGPQTAHAFTVYEARRTNGGKPAAEVERWRDGEEGAGASPTPAQAVIWPRQAEVAGFFGPVGSAQVRLDFAYPMRIAWDTKQLVSGTSCHAKVRDAFRRVFARTLDHYGHETLVKLGLDLFGGCLNVRRMRGGSAWSMHAWGIAFDIDPARNQLRWGRDRAELAKPAYEPFWSFVAAEGLVSLGKSRNYDWMHFQAARL